MIGSTTLLTGATGMLGPDLVGRLLPATERLLVLIRSGDEPAERRFARLRQEMTERGVTSDGLELVAGDLLQPTWGLSPSGYERLAARVDRILHGAAATRFSLPLEEARQANVETTRRVLEFARACRRLEGLGFISTAFVAGTRTGQIAEDDLEAPGFVNTYEQSKFEAEQILRRAMADLPVAVYRLSTVIGSSRTGRVPKVGAIHRAIRLHHQGLLPMLTGDPDGPVDLIDLEYPAQAVTHLLLEGFEPGTTYHIVAGSERSYTLAALLEETHRLLGELDSIWEQKQVEIPPIVPPAAFERFADGVEETTDPDFVSVLRTLSFFAPQLLHPKTFDTSRRDQALPADVVPPPIWDYYPDVIRWCLEHGWGQAP